MAVIKDFSFDKDEYASTKEYSGTNAIILAVRNILLSRPGNFPFSPSLGMNIEKYQFDLLDDQTIENIQVELSNQINEYLPAFDSVNIHIQKVVDEDDIPYLGITVSSIGESNDQTVNFLLKQNEGSIDILNEIN